MSHTVINLMDQRAIGGLGRLYGFGVEGPHRTVGMNSRTGVGFQTFGPFSDRGAGHALGRVFLLVGPEGHQGGMWMEETQMKEERRRWITVLGQELSRLPGQPVVLVIPVLQRPCGGEPCVPTDSVEMRMVIYPLTPQPPHIVIAPLKL